MKKILILLLLLGIVSISGCSPIGGIQLPTSSNAKTGPAQVDNTGNGLQINLNMNSDPTSVKSGKLRPILSISNTGKFPITLSRNNFQILTIEKSANGSNVITDNSINQYYQKIFGGNSLTLIQNQQENNIGGVLQIAPSYFNDITNSQFTYLVKANYDYKTIFSNNMVVDLQSNPMLKITDSLSQAAPVKVTGIKLEEGIAQSEYDLTFTLQNSQGGLTSNSQTQATITSTSFNFNKIPLNDCSYYDNQGNQLSKNNLILNNKNSKISITCKINLANYQANSGPVNGMISGTINYKYQIQTTGTINLGDRTKSSPIQQ